MLDPAEFAAFLSTLAKGLPKFAPDVKTVAPSWYELFKSLESEALPELLTRALLHFEEFPSCKQLLTLLGMAPRDEDDLGREVAEKIWAAIERFGSTLTLSRLKEIEDNVGEVSWAVVLRCGGWNAICDGATYDNMTTTKSQWRELAAGLIRKSRAGFPMDLPPTFDDGIGHLPQRARDAFALAEKALNLPKNHKDRL